MKITVVFPYNTWGGAFRSTYIYCNHLVERGHEVKLIFPFFPPKQNLPKNRVSKIITYTKALLRSALRYKKIPFDLKFKVQFVPWISNLFIPNADIIIINHWETTFSVKVLDSSKGVKVLYIRDVEQWSENFDKQLQAFKLDVFKIVVAKWIKTKLELEHNISINKVIPNGTDWKPFFIPNKQFNKTTRITMCYATHPMKDMPTGIKVLERIKDIFGSKVDICLFGFPKKPKLNFNIEYIYRPTGNKLKEVYSKSDIFFCPSIQEGYHNPPREAMSAGCAVVATNVGCMPDIGIDGINYIKCEIGEIDGTVQKISELLMDKNLIKKLGLKSQIEIQKYSWENTVNEIENYLYEIRK